jgi:hypothetical protein
MTQIIWVDWVGAFPPPHPPLHLCTIRFVLNLVGHMFKHPWGKPQHEKHKSTSPNTPNTPNTNKQAEKANPKKQPTNKQAALGPRPSGPSAPTGTYLRPEHKNLSVRQQFKMTVKQMSWVAVRTFWNQFNFNQKNVFKKKEIQNLSRNCVKTLKLTNNHFSRVWNYLLRHIPEFRMVRVYQ